MLSGLQQCLLADGCRRAEPDFGGSTGGLEMKIQSHECARMAPERCKAMFGWSFDVYILEKYRFASFPARTGLGSYMDAGPFGGSAIGTFRFGID